MDWSDSWHGAFRIELRAQAIGLAWRGWQVMPGTYPAANDGPVPVFEDWAERINTATAGEIADWWNGEQPHSLLVATGKTLDAIEVGDELGRQTAAVLRSTGLPVPIAATPSGRWLFLTEAGEKLHSELAGNADIVLHTAGSFIPLPPSTFLQGIVHWRVRPEVCGWDLPASRVVQDAMLRAVPEKVGYGYSDLLAA
jgi:hypothetical protein